MCSGIHRKLEGAITEIKVYVLNSMCFVIGLMLMVDIMDMHLFSRSVASTNQRERQLVNAESEYPDTDRYLNCGRIAAQTETSSLHMCWSVVHCMLNIIHELVFVKTDGKQAEKIFYTGRTGRQYSTYTTQTHTETQTQTQRHRPTDKHTHTHTHTHRHHARDTYNSHKKVLPQ